MKLSSIRLPLWIAVCMTFFGIGQSRADPRANPKCTKAGWCTVFELPPERTKVSKNRVSSTEVSAGLPGRSGQWLGTIWGTGPSDIFAVGRYTTVHFDGKSWRRVENHSKSAIFDIDGSGPTDVYAVGSYQTIQRWDGTDWKLEHMDMQARHRTATGAFGEVVVTAPGQAYAFTRGSTFERVNGRWSKVVREFDRSEHLPETPLGLNELCSNRVSSTQASESSKGTSATWFARCDNNRRSYVHDGRAWKSLGKLPASTDHLIAAFAVAPGNLVASFAKGRVHRHNGTRWTREDQGIPDVVRGFWSDGIWLYATTKTVVLRKRL